MTWGITNPKVFLYVFKQDTLAICQKQFCGNAGIYPVRDWFCVGRGAKSREEGFGGGASPIPHIFWFSDAGNARIFFNASSVWEGWALRQADFFLPWSPLGPRSTCIPPQKEFCCCNRIALQSHCIAIALHRNRIALQSDCIALQSHAIALHCNRIALHCFATAPGWPMGPSRSLLPPSPPSWTEGGEKRALAHSGREGKKTEEEEEEGNE